MSEQLERQELEVKVEQYINGELSAAEVDELWAELVQDEERLDYLKNVANLKSVINKRKKKEVSRTYWYYSAAAAIALLITVASFAGFFMPNGAGVQPLTQVELNYYRSADVPSATTSESEIIRKAITLANTGKVSEAINLLQKELEMATRPEWIAKLSLNLGSLFYNQGDFPRSIEYYSKVISNKEYIDVLMLEKAYWYRGNAYFQEDQLTKARENIQKAYDLNGAYRRVTESYLKALS